MEEQFKVGDTIYWYCDICDCVHSGVVKFVNRTFVGYKEINYEVEAFCCEEKKTLFIDYYDAMEKDLSEA
ncbi:hypothetical protein [Fibrobacter intestinalis]|uniref:Uncharacterized protein n=1 Tax=Fibrobacter intestinalis TaxID=28122 RepID=A0A1T4REV1_9BACT|nr:MULTISPECIES: hypothetical protein [Fibrobacter]PBC72506.1 hypothetical protein BGW94_0076 [Fibrobacter sp. NR9]SKA14429.1 hypothetical protein SAMN02745108_02677 [Fibrobacter intestinalis]